MRCCGRPSDYEGRRRLSASDPGVHPEIAWRRIAAFGNVIVHKYLGIDMEQIWAIIERDVPDVARAVAAMLEGKP